MIPSLLKISASIIDVEMGKFCVKELVLCDKQIDDKATFVAPSKIKLSNSHIKFDSYVLKFGAVDERLISCISRNEIQFLLVKRLI